mgnify:CR=1 FL=1
MFYLLVLAHTNSYFHVYLLLLFFSYLLLQLELFKDIISGKQKLFLKNLVSCVDDAVPLFLVGDHVMVAVRTCNAGCQPNKWSC